MNKIITNIPLQRLGVNTDQENLFQKKSQPKNGRIKRQKKITPKHLSHSINKDIFHFIFTKCLE
jgi:hypothetical protein